MPLAPTLAVSPEMATVLPKKPAVVASLAISRSTCDHVLPVRSKT